MINLKLPKTFDWTLSIIPFILVCTGIAIIYSLTYYNDQISIVYDQTKYAAIGAIVMVVLTFVDYRNYKNFSWLFYFLGLVLLILVLVIGKSSFGAKRWINLIFFDLQPSEFMKLFLIFPLSAFLSERIGELNYKRIFFAIAMIIIPVFLVLRQPDFGSAIVIVGIGLAMILFSRLTKKQMITILLLCIILIPTAWLSLHDYQKQRVFTFLNPTADRFGSGYNVIQSMITVGNGGLTGKGFGHGPQSQLNFLPVAHTDFIFAGFAESVGFVGGVILIMIFVVLIFRIFNVAIIAKDYFGMLLAIGIAIMFFVQAFINIGMNIGIMPVTGIPLPLVSYGGSSMLLNLSAIGILQSIYLRHKKISFPC